MSHVKKIISQELTEAGITKGFQSAVEAYRSESLKLQDLRDEQDKLVNTFKKSTPEQKEKLKKDLIAMHKKVQSQKKAVDRAETKFNKMVMDEPEELEESSYARKGWWKRVDKKDLPKIKDASKEGDRWAVEVQKPNSDKYLIGLGRTKKQAYEDALSKAYKEDVKGWMSESRDLNERQSMDFYAIKDGKVFRSFPSRQEASKWLRDNRDKHSGVSLRSKKDWEEHKARQNESINESFKEGDRVKITKSAPGDRGTALKGKKGTIKSAMKSGYIVDVDGISHKTFMLTKDYLVKESINEANGDTYTLQQLKKAMADSGKFTRKEIMTGISSKLKKITGNVATGSTEYSKEDISDAIISLNHAPKDVAEVWSALKELINEKTLYDTRVADLFNVAKQQVAKKLGVTPKQVHFSTGQPAKGGMFQGIYTIDGNDFLVKLDPKGKVRKVTGESKSAAKRMTEALSKDEAKTLYSILKSATSLADLKAPLKEAGFKKVKFEFNPFPHFKIKNKGNDTIVVTSKSFVQNPEIEVNDLAAGIVEGVRVVKESQCGSCDEYKSRLVEEMDIFPEAESENVYPDISDFFEDIESIKGNWITFTDDSELALIHRNNTVRVRPRPSIASMMKAVFDQTDINTNDLRNMIIKELPKSKIHE